MKIPYFLLDVFTKDKFAGNPLAVVLHAETLSERQMQAIAAEFNLSETAFMKDADKDHQTSSLRIFTPKTELPFAGHPTIGAAVLTGLRQRVSAVRLEEHLGVITCVTERAQPWLGYARFALPLLPADAGEAPADDAIAGALGISPDDIGIGAHRPSVYSAGLSYYLVPVHDSGVLKRIKLERRNWASVFPLGSGAVYAYTLTPENENVDIMARMFSPGSGPDEDPATGSAAAALLGQMAVHSGLDGGQVHYKLLQGYEMGRPSLIEMQMRIKEGKLSHAGIGGWAVLVGEGHLDLRDM